MNARDNHSDLKDSGSRQGFQSGAVRDAQENKGAFHLVPEVVTFLLSRVYEEGARKYAARNWEKGMPISVYINSAQRHLAKYKMGLRDEPHLSQALWNVTGALWTGVMVHLGLRDQALNDLPNHVGFLSKEGIDPDDRVDSGLWETPVLSQSEINSLKVFGLSREIYKQHEESNKKVDNE